MARITGIGGVFLRAKSDEKALAGWYEKHLGLKLEDFGGAVLKWPSDPAADVGATAWHVAGKDSGWFSGPFMINYRIDDMDGMIHQLNAGGIPIVQGPDSDENGRFLWIMDPDGNKVELWEPTPAAAKSL